MSTLVSARTLSEYKAMFRLDELEPAASILDCAAGAASFAAESASFERTVVALDPLYARGFSEIEAIVLEGVAQTRRNVEADPERYNFGAARSPFCSAREHAQARESAAQDFLRDFKTNWPSRYVAGSLTRIPFADKSIDYALCSHLLFLHARDFDVAFHVDAIRELCRVARKGVRIYPLVGFEADATPALAAVLTEVQRLGFYPSQPAVDYSFLEGADAMLSVDLGPEGLGP